MQAQQTAILTKLVKEQCLGAKHITETNLLKGFPRHLIGDLKTALDKLVKQNYVIKHPTKHGWAYALNQKRLAEIYEILANP